MVGIESEMQLKGLLKIKDWKELKDSNILRYIKLLPNMRKQLHFKVLEQVPGLSDKISGAMDLVKSSINESEKLSTETKEAYVEIIRALEETLKRDDLSREEHEKVFDELVRIASFIDTASRRDEEFLDKVVDDIFKTAAVVIIAAGVFFGARSILAALL